jgi:anaerobic magnesium-protoporphyrin IX monomethyl ester cyclase
MFGRKVRRQSVEKVVSDIRFHRERGFGKFFFYDDNFTANRRWSRDLLDRLQHLDIQFNAQVRVDFAWKDRRRTQIDSQLLSGMARAGADVLYIGYETIEEATAEHWKKGYRGQGSLRDRLMEDTGILHDHGCWIHGMFVLGPEHTEDTARGIVDFSRRSKIETMQISILTPFPGTELYDEMRSDLIFTDYPVDWDFYDGTHCVYDNSRMGLQRLQEVLLESHRDFYRWGGLSLRRIRAFLKEEGSLPAKLIRLSANARIARKTLKAWQRENKQFLHTATKKLIGEPVPS